MDPERRAGLSAAAEAFWRAATGCALIFPIRCRGLREPLMGLWEFPSTVKVWHRSPPAGLISATERIQVRHYAAACEDYEQSSGAFCVFRCGFREMR